MSAPERPKSRGVGLLALVVVQICFGLFPVFGHVAMRDGAFQPMAVAFWRVAVGSVVLFGLALAAHGRRAIPARGDVLRLLVCAILGVALNQGLYLEGLKRSSSVNAGLLMCLIPIFTYAIAASLRLEAVRTTRVIGIIIALGGAVPMFVARGADVADHRLGNLLLASNALSYSFYLVLARPLLLRLPALVVIAWVYLLAAPALPWFAHGVDLAPPFSGNETPWRALAWILVFPTVLAYLLNGVALARVRASTTALAILAQPFITAIAGWAWLGETVPAAVLMSGACVLAGFLLVSLPRSASGGAVQPTVAASTPASSPGASMSRSR